MSHDLIIGIITGILLTLFIIILFYLIFSRSNKIKELRLNQKKRNISLFQSFHNQKEASPKLQKKLLDMVGGNREEAEKIIAKIRFGKHGKSESYYYWKAIQELQSKTRNQIDKNHD